MAEPIYITISNTPRAVLHVMDGLISRHNEQQEQLDKYAQQLVAYAAPIRKRIWISWGLLLLGVPFFLVDYTLGFGGLLFALVGAFCWLAAFITARAVLIAVRPDKGNRVLAIAGTIIISAALVAIYLMVAPIIAEIAAFVITFIMVLTQHISSRPARIRTSISSEGALRLPQHYHTAREVIYALRDDAAQKSTFIGHLDLTGPQKQEKLMRESKNARGLKVEYYRDEWLNLKAKLHDGNVLRFTAMEIVKVRLSYRKRSRSGKMKTKPAKFKNAQEIKIKLAVNPHVYAVARTPEAQPGTRSGGYTITRMSVEDDSITIQATSQKTTIEPGDILTMLKFAYSQLQRRSAP